MSRRSDTLVKLALTFFAVVLLATACKQQKSSIARRSIESMNHLDFRLNRFHEWCLDLPLEFGTFYGKPLTIRIDNCRSGSLEHPSESDMKLLEEVLADLPKILDRAKREFEAYESDPAFVEHLLSPQIWFSTSEDENYQLNDWALVLERSDWNDYGCHIEFRGSEFREIWGGD